MYLANGHARKSEKLWCPGNILRRFALRDDIRSCLSACGRRNVAAVWGVIQRSSMEAEEVAMTSFVRPAWLALAFVATAVPASAQTWVYESDIPGGGVG